ncbi:MAG: M15 family metallopeptidase [Chlorobiaceae bacterium]|jgi:D-alanyl-D-alanine dipeptidase|nr:M15 family metallopeptidase [Chlorobiaceae bacterium]
MRSAFFCFLFCFVSAQSVFAREPDLMFADIADYDSSIVLDIRYATTNNFTGKRIYPAARCLLRRDVAMRLLKVQQTLRSMGYRLIVFDCYRPLSVQKVFRTLLSDKGNTANHATESRCNRGASVDVSLADSFGIPLSMPTEYADFSKKASRSRKGSSAEAKHHAMLLETVMKSEGFDPFPEQWWHFDAYEWKLYPVSDFPLEKTGSCEDD